VPTVVRNECRRMVVARSKAIKSKSSRSFTHRLKRFFYVGLYVLVRSLMTRKTKTTTTMTVCMSVHQGLERPLMRRVRQARGKRRTKTIQSRSSRPMSVTTSKRVLYLNDAQRFDNKPSRARQTVDRSVSGVQWSPVCQSRVRLYAERAASCQLGMQCSRSALQVYCENQMR